MPLSMSEKQSVSNVMREEYRKASKKQKHVILDQFIKLTGYNRNYASRKLRLGKKSAIKSRYSYNVIHSAYKFFHANIYRSKDLIEKAFSDLKDRLSMRLTSISSEENMEGKLFLQFIGLIYLSYVKHAMDKAGLFKNYTMQELFDELDVIERYQLPGEAAYYGEITDKQRKLYTALRIEPPA